MREEFNLKNLGYPMLTEQQKRRQGQTLAACSVLTRPESAFVGSAYGANIGTGAAVYTSVSVDNVLAVALGNSRARTFFCTSTAHDAFVINYICHGLITSLFD